MAIQILGQDKVDITRHLVAHVALVAGGYCYSNVGEIPQKLSDFLKDLCLASQCIHQFLIKGPHVWKGKYVVF